MAVFVSIVLDVGTDDDAAGADVWDVAIGILATGLLSAAFSTSNRK